MYIAILGRQPELGAAELERLYGDVTWFSHESVTVRAESIDFARLGGSQKVGRVLLETSGDWRAVSTKLVHAFINDYKTATGKLTIGISAYNFPISARDVQKTGLILKSKLKQHGVSVRLIPNSELALSTATSHHNKLGLSDNKLELLIIRGRDGKVIVAASTGAQNITAYARRDQNRPKRDAFVGMLPPKLAQMMVNLASPGGNGRADVAENHQTPAQARESDSKNSSRAEDCLSNASSAGAEEIALSDTRRTEAVSGNSSTNAGKAARNRSDVKPTLLDPFCGTGVILQEAALMGYNTYGTDLAEKMIDYSQINLDWLKASHRVDFAAKLHAGDAMDTKWSGPISAVTCETYLGQPFSAPPSPAKLAEVRKNCDMIISRFLKNLAPQLAPGTPVCLGVPAWRGTDGRFTHLPLTQDLGSLGFTPVSLKTATGKKLLYYREDQVVARELLVLVKK